MERSSKIYSAVSIYLNDAYLKDNLEKRFRAEEDRYAVINYKDLINITNIDEYVYRLIIENTPNNVGTPLNTYLKVINKELEEQPLLLLSLPISKVKPELLKKYLPNLDKIYNKLKQQNINSYEIYKTYMENSNLVSSEQLNKLLLFFSYNIPYTDSELKNAMENFTFKILNNPPTNANEYYVAKFLIKFFGYKKIREEELGKTKIIIANHDTRGKRIKNNYISINKQLLENVSLSIKYNYLENRYEKTLGCEDILRIIHILYHELRHQKQTQEAKKGKLNDISLFMASRHIISDFDNNFDYTNNYQYYETEKDANIKAWEEIEKLIKTYMPEKDLQTVTKNILKHKLTEEIEQITGTRLDKENKLYLSNTLLVKYLDEALKIKPYIITKNYKQFTLFYNDNGIPKKEIELLTIPDVKEYKEFYFAQTTYRSKMPDYKMRSADIYRIPTKDIKIIINNLNILMEITQTKLNKIENKIKKSDSLDQVIVTNIINYHQYAIYLSTLTDEILKRKPELINSLTVKNAVNNMNKQINMINNNPLVKRVINFENQISIIGRGR